MAASYLYWGLDFAAFVTRGGCSSVGEMSRRAAGG